MSTWNHLAPPAISAPGALRAHCDRFRRLLCLIAGPAGPAPTRHPRRRPPVRRANAARRRADRS